MEKRLTVVGSGVYNYDVIVRREYPEGFTVGQRNKFEEKVLLEEVGGTCGNVVCILARLGWHVLPQAQLDQSEQGYKLKADLERYGCDARYVENIPNGGTVLLRCTHQLDKETGKPITKFRATGPSSLFARRKQLRVKDEVQPFLDSLEQVPEVFFFDSSEAGPRAIAEALRAKGTLIYYEPESDKEASKFKNGIRLADIIKFSGEKVTDTSFCDGNDKLFIQTLGSDGLKFKLGLNDWIHIPAVHVDNVVDTEGCGDTTTAVFIDELAKRNVLSIKAMTVEIVTDALRIAAAKGAECSQYLSSKGWLNN